MSRANYTHPLTKVAFTDNSIELKEAVVGDLKPYNQSGLINLQGNLYGDGVYAVGALAEVETAKIVSNDGVDAATLSQGVMKMEEHQIAYATDTDASYSQELFVKRSNHTVDDTPSTVTFPFYVNYATTYEIALISADDDTENFNIKFYDSQDNQMTVEYKILHNSTPTTGTVNNFDILTAGGDRHEVGGQTVLSLKANLTDSGVKNYVFGEIYNMMEKYSILVDLGSTPDGVADPPAYFTISTVSSTSAGSLQGTGWVKTVYSNEKNNQS